MSLASEILADSPLWFLDLQETSGTAYNDQGSLNQDATGTSATAGAKSVVPHEPSDKAVSLAGAGYLLSNSTFSLGLSNANILTMECMVEVDDVTVRQTLFGMSDNNTTSVPWLEIGNSSGEIAVSVNGTFVVRTASNVIRSHRLHHIVYKRTGSGSGTHHVFVDGVEVTLSVDGAGSYVDSNQKKLVGGRTTSTQLFTGRISHVAVYDAALSDARIAAHYATVKPVGYDETVAVDDPYAWYKADETSGTTLADSGLGGNSATLSGSPTVNQTSLLPVGTGKSVRFTGTSGQYASSTLGYSSAANWSFECWIKFNSRRSGVNAIAQIDTETNFYMRAGDAGVDESKIQGHVNGSSDFLSALNTIANGTIYHLVVTRDATNVKLYVNGSLNVTVTTGSAVASGVLKFPWEFTNGRESDCWMQHVAVYQKALTPNRVATHYAAGVGQYSAEVLADSPLAYYRLGETSGTVMSDSSPNALDGAYVSSPSLQATSLIYGDTNNAVQFVQASSDEATSNTSSTLRPSNLVMEVIVKSPSINSGSAIWRDDTSSGGWLLNAGVSPSTNVQYRISGTTYTSSVANTVLTDGLPHHVVVRATSTTVDLWIDGVQRDSQTRSGTTAASGKWHLARNGTTSGQYADMYADEWAFYSSLSDDRIMAHAAVALGWAHPATIAATGAMQAPTVVVQNFTATPTTLVATGAVQTIGILGDQAVTVALVSATGAVQASVPTARATPAALAGTGVVQGAALLDTAMPPVVAAAGSVQAPVVTILGDAFGNPFIISGSGSGTYSNLGFSFETGDPDLSGAEAGSPTAWFKYVGVASGALTFTLDQLPADYVLEVYSVGSDDVMTVENVQSIAFTPGDAESVDSLLPSSGAWWGFYKPPASGETQVTAYTNMESAVGRQFNVIRRYHDMSGAGSNGVFPDVSEQTLASGGRLLFPNLSSRDYHGSQYTWADIAAGNYDPQLTTAARQAATFGHPMLMSFDSEMDGGGRVMEDGSAGTKGTAAEFVAAWNHIRDLYIAEGATNVQWAWCPTGYSGHWGNLDRLWPGDTSVDWIAWDPYNYSVSSWKTPYETFEPFYTWLMDNGYDGYPFILAEYGTVQDPDDSSRASDWYAAVPAALELLPNIKGACQWDSTVSAGDTRITATELPGFTSAGLDSYVNPTVSTSSATSTSLTVAVSEGVTYWIRLYPVVASNTSATLGVDWTFTTRDTPAGAGSGALLEDVVLDQAPGYLTISLGNGTPGDLVDFYLDNDLGTLVLEDDFDDSGAIINAMVPVSERAAGNYVLNVRSDSYDTDMYFTVLEDPDTDPTEPLDPADDFLESPSVDTVVHWVIKDTVAPFPTFEFEVNPDEMGSPYPERTYTVEASTAPDGQPITWQGMEPSTTWTFSGWLTDAQQINDLMDMCDLNRRVWLYDHLNRRCLVSLEHLDAVPHRNLLMNYLHRFTLTVLMFTTAHFTDELP